VSIEVHPATADRWDDLFAIFAGDGPLGCWCQYWRHSASDYREGGAGSGERNLRLQVKTGPTPGLVAYRDGEPAGWLGFWPREKLERLVRSRTIPRIDDEPVWSVVCFKVRVGHRRMGVAEALLGGAIDFARSHGIGVLEAYPIDPEGERVDVAFAYVGFASMFDRHGFERVLVTEAKSARRPRWLMRLHVT